MIHPPANNEQNIKQIRAGASYATQSALSRSCLAQRKLNENRGFSPILSEAGKNMAMEP
jgi:hypothetical protein